MSKKDWFQDWFNTPYYHILYKNRDHDEAKSFIRNLLSFLRPKDNATFLDLACGKGRHSIFLHSFGHLVSGCDLSEKSIDHAKNFETEGLNFFVQDMRNSTGNKYDYVLNLFTSLGYFDSSNENQQMFDAVYSDLNSNGVLVIDFLNEIKVRKGMIPLEKKRESGIEFTISKWVEDNRIHKKIEFKDEQQDFSFVERVELLSLAQIKNYAIKSGFELEHIFGNYLLEDYNDNSDRLILIFRKK
jgi:SAM-dependent methyltransferase